MAQLYGLDALDDRLDHVDVLVVTVVAMDGFVRLADVVADAYTGGSSVRLGLADFSRRRARATYASGGNVSRPARKRRAISRFWP